MKEDAKQKAEAKQEAEAAATEAEAAREKEQADIAIAEGHSLAAPVLTLPPARTIRTALPSPCPPACLHACLPAASVATAKDALNKTAEKAADNLTRARDVEMLRVNIAQGCEGKAVKEG